MQKKLIALAVAGLLSAPAFAQSNVQIYGIVDLGFRSLGGGEAQGGLDKPARSNAIANDGQSSSRLGFKGTEDLGNGLKAFFTIEQGLNADASAASGNRQIFVGLDGGFGKVWMGRDFNPSRSLISGLDPFGATGIGSVQDIFSLTSRYDNAIMYTTPNMSGFTVSLAYSTNVSGDDNDEFKNQQDLNTKGYSITPMYKNGPLKVGFGYEKYSDVGADSGPDGDDRKRWHIGGSYDFGVVDLRLAYGKTTDELSGASDVDQKSWMIGAVAPVSERGQVLALYTRTKVEESGSSDAKASKFALGYVHSLSKRTSVYATYAKVSTNDEAEGAFGLGGVDEHPDEVSGETYGWTSGFHVGITHKF